MSSSIANLYRRPRVWLEGYHSLGWGATPERLMFATRENYLYGCTLLNLHGLYYSTYGSHWEWAPPCYHFRMPYWAHMDVFLGYFDRLSYLMSQGHHVCDVAVIYPVAPYEADMNGRNACGTAFDMANRLMSAGINFDFIDNDSLARAVVENGRLVVKAAGASYRALVFPNMEAVRRESIEKAAAFGKAGGKVLIVGSLPKASDIAGRNDSQLQKLNAEAFRDECRFKSNDQAVNFIRSAFVQDVRGVGLTVRALHRKVGPRDVYLVMGAKPGSVVEFRAKGAVELWDPWTGTVRSLKVVKETETGTKVKLILEEYEAQVVVFTPDKKHVDPPEPDNRPLLQKTVTGDWTVSFISTMDNRYGDFRLPVTEDNKRIGVEARRFAWTRDTAELSKTAMLGETNDQSWQRVLHGYGPQFYALGPVPSGVDCAALDAKLAKITSVDPAVPVKIGSNSIKWQTYDFSWRYGKEGDLGHQGYHGLKRTVTDDFICLGQKGRGRNETRYVDAKAGKVYYLWTSATVPEDVKAKIHASTSPPEDKSHTSPVITPAAVYINGGRLASLGQSVELKAGPNPILVRYDHAGRGHFVLRKQGCAFPKEKRKLAMRWYKDPGVIPFDIYAGKTAAQWFRFLSAPGTAVIRVQALGEAKAWIDGKPMTHKGDGRFEAPKPVASSAIVALRVDSPAGYSGGTVIPEPVMIETATGTMPLGDWSNMGILNNYSGGVRYSNTISLTEADTKGIVIVDLGQVLATAEVHINGKKAGVRVAPPWRLNVTGLLKTGENTIEVIVYNTLANHYQTIPSRYRGSPKSGLMGPVKFLSRDFQEGETATQAKKPEPPRKPKPKPAKPKPVNVVSTVGNVRITKTTSSLKECDKNIKANNNLLLKKGMIKSITGSNSHDGGGKDFSALFNGTAGNGNGDEKTLDDGKTFIGMGAGNTLDIILAKGITIDEIRTYASHGDARASQNYTVYASTKSSPDTFVKIAKIAYDASGVTSAVSISSSKDKPLIENVGRIRFVFGKSSAGFNVYREIAVFGR